MANEHTTGMSSEEYFRLFEQGHFNGRRVELIGGEIVEMSPQNNPHVAGVTMVLNALQLAFGPGFWVRIQGTLNLSPHGCPDPDFAVVPGMPQHYLAQPIPTSALLVVEVSDTTLRYDRCDKMSLYAASGIAEYWIVNIPDRQIEVYRDPVADPNQPFNYRYGTMVVLQPGEMVSPLAVPAAQIPVADLLP